MRGLPGGFGAVHLFGLDSDPAAHKGMIGVAVGTLEGASGENVIEVYASGDNQVQLMPVL